MLVANKVKEAREKLRRAERALDAYIYSGDSDYESLKPKFQEVLALMGRCLGLQRGGHSCRYCGER